MGRRSWVGRGGPISYRQRAGVRVDEAAIQIEVNVDADCPSMPVPTSGFALAQGQPSRIVRVMALERTLAHKLAAWNERRLLRDLYDVYFLATRAELAVELRVAADSLTEGDLADELAPLLPADELVALIPRLRAVIVRVAEELEESG